MTLFDPWTRAIPNLCSVVYNFLNDDSMISFLLLLPMRARANQGQIKSKGLFITVYVCVCAIELRIRVSCVGKI